MKYIIIAALLILKIQTAQAQAVPASYYKIPVLFATYMEGRRTVYEGAGFQFEIDHYGILGLPCVGVMFEKPFQPAFDSLWAGYWGVADTTIYLLDLNN